MEPRTTPITLTLPGLSTVFGKGFCGWLEIAIGCLVLVVFGQFRQKSSCPRAATSSVARDDLLKDWYTANNVTPMKEPLLPRYWRRIRSICLPSPVCFFLSLYIYVSMAAVLARVVAALAASKRRQSKILSFTAGLYRPCLLLSFWLSSELAKTSPAKEPRAREVMSIARASHKGMDR